MAAKERVLAAGTTLFILSALAILIILVAHPKDGQAFSEFYILGPGGYAVGYPHALDVNEGTVLVMGIVNHENATVDYRVEATLNGDSTAVTLTTDEADATTIGGSVFELPGIADEAESEHRITVAPLVAGDHQKLEFLLFSSLPRVGCITGSVLPDDGYVSLQLDERNGNAKVTVRASETRATDCRIEAWQDDSLVAEQCLRAEAGEEGRFTVEHPPGKTLFRVYDGDTLALDDSGAMLTLNLWVDVTDHASTS